jgi:hypothetical protein
MQRLFRLHLETRIGYSLAQDWAITNSPIRVLRLVGGVGVESRQGVLRPNQTGAATEPRFLFGDTRKPSGADVQPNALRLSCLPLRLGTLRVPVGGVVAQRHVNLYTHVFIRWSPVQVQPRLQEFVFLMAHLGGCKPTGDGTPF